MVKIYLTPSDPNALDEEKEEYREDGLIFKSHDHYINIWNIDNWLHFLYKPNPDFDTDDDISDEPLIVINSGFREDENLFYNTLREVNKLLDIVEPICFIIKEETMFEFEGLCRNITELLLEAKKFKHNNPKIEKNLRELQKN